MKYIDRILKYLKRVKYPDFNSAKKELVACEFIVEEPLVNEKQKQLISNLRVWDIVFCMMPTDEIIKNKIPESHQFRPYVIVGVYPDYVEGLYCTTTDRTERSKYLTHEIKGNCKLRKKTYVEVSDGIFKIPVSHLKEYVDKIKKDDKIELYRLLKMEINRGKAPERMINPNLERTLSYRKGDKVEVDDTKYYISNTEGNNILTLAPYKKGIPLFLEEEKVKIEPGEQERDIKLCGREIKSNVKIYDLLRIFEYMREMFKYCNLDETKSLSPVKASYK